MASFRKRGEKWQARVHKKGGNPEVKTFLTKADATKWARHVESRLDLGFLATKQAMPKFKCLIKRYSQEVTPSKKGQSQEKYRASQIQDFKFATLPLDQVKAETIARFRDERLKKVSPNTVRLELAFISSVFEQARKEWGYEVVNPIRQIRIPKPSKPRQRRLESGEESALLEACKTSNATYLHSFVVLAIETGMRFSELTCINWDNVNIKKQSVYLPDTKNGHPRNVPLSMRALQAIQLLPYAADGRLFNVKPGSIRSAFLVALDKGQKSQPENLKFLQGLRFHDLRHEAVTRLFERGLNPIEVGMISGHRTLAMLQRYVHIRAEDLALKLG